MLMNSNSLVEKLLDNKEINSIITNNDDIEK